MDHHRAKLVPIQSKKAKVPAQSCTYRIGNNYFPAAIYLLKVNNRNTRTRCKICSKLTIKAPERRLALFWCLYR